MTIFILEKKNKFRKLILNKAYVKISWQISFMQKRN